MEDVVGLTGNYAVAHAARLARVELACFFPIGPSDEVGETIRALINRGEMRARIMDLQNERSSINAQIAATEAGVRSIFATNSEGLLYGQEQIKHASYARLPMVIAVANRALEPPLIVTPDYQDAIMQRDMGWLCLFCENAKDVLDTTIQAYRIAEDPGVRLPVFVCYEGWEVSHSTYPCRLPSQDTVDSFLPPLSVQPESDILNFSYREHYGERTLKAWLPEGYMELRYRLVEAMKRSEEVIEVAGRDYRRLTGTEYGGLGECYRTEDAEVIVLTMGSITSTARFAVDVLREAESAVGLVKLRAFRPFPGRWLREALKDAETVLVIERDISAALFHELRSAFYSLEKRPLILGRVAGIGGRDVTYYDVAFMVEEALAAAGGGPVQREIAWHFPSYGSFKSGRASRSEFAKR